MTRRQPSMIRIASGTAISCLLAASVPMDVAAASTQDEGIQPAPVPIESQPETQAGAVEETPTQEDAEPGVDPEVIAPELNSTPDDAAERFDLGEALGPDDAPRTARLARASALLVKLDRAEVAEAVADAITNGPAAYRRPLLRALDLARPPSAVRGALLGLARNGEAPTVDRAAAVRMTARYYDRETAAALLDLISEINRDAAPGSPELEVRAEAFDALREISGRRDLGNETQTWAGWLQDVFALSAADWETAVSRRLQARLMRRELELTLAMSELLETYRRLNLTREPEQRPALIEELLRSPMREVRALGFELANRELAESRRPGEAVQAAAVRLLGAASPRERSEASLLVGRLGGETGRNAVLEALDRENDATAAETLLRVAQRWPSPRVVAPALQWLEHSPRLRAAAAETLWSLEVAGLLGPEDHARIAEVLGTVDPSAWSEPIAKLLVVAGDASQQELVALQLTAPFPVRRQIAARALAAHPAFVDQLIDAAASDAELYSVVTSAVLDHRKTAEGYRALSDLPSPDDATRTTALNRLRDQLTLPELLRTAQQVVQTTEQRASLLSSLESPARQTALDVDNFARYERGVLALADVRLELGRPASALDALDLLSPAAPAAEPEQRAALRLSAYILLDELDRAVALDAGADAWLTALERAAELPQAARAEAVVAERLLESMTDEQLSRLQQIRETIQNAQSEENGAADMTPTSDAVES